MPVARLPGVDINFEVVGDSGPWVALIQGGRHPLDEMAITARAVAAGGFRVLVHDRRNCGRSSVDFDGVDSEDEVWVDDMLRLFDEVVGGPVVLLGRSRGARLALLLVRREPSAMRGLFLWGISAGRVALRFLDEYYFGKYLRACRSGGMPAVVEIDHFAALAAARPGNRELLLAMPPATFVATMSRWRDEFMVGCDWPVMGVADDDLAAISVPAAVAPFHDSVHPEWAARHAVRMIPGAEFVEFDAARLADTRDESMMARRFIQAATRWHT